MKTTHIVYLDRDYDYDSALSEVKALAVADGILESDDHLETYLDCTDVAPFMIDYLAQWDNGDSPEEPEDWKVYPGETQLGPHNGYVAAIDTGLGTLRLSYIEKD